MRHGVRELAGTLGYLNHPGPRIQRKISRTVPLCRRAVGRFDLHQGIEERVILRGGADPLVGKAVGIAGGKIFDPRAFRDDYNARLEIGAEPGLEANGAALVVHAYTLVVRYRPARRVGG